MLVYNILDQVAADAQNDEFAKYFDCERTPKILITTNKKSSLVSHLYLVLLVGWYILLRYQKRKLNLANNTREVCFWEPW